MLRNYWKCLGISAEFFEIATESWKISDDWEIFNKSWNTFENKNRVIRTKNGSLKCNRHSFVLRSHYESCKNFWE